MNKFRICFIFIFFIIVFQGISYSASQKPVRLAYVKWSTEIASTTVVKAVFQEELGIPCTTIPMKADEMWEAVAAGDVDGMVAAWLPGTHGSYYAKYKSEVEDLGPNLFGTRIGLVVPKVAVGRQTGRSGIVNDPYITAKSIADLKKYRELFKGRIIGIDSEAGIMEKTRKAIKAYGLDGYRLVDGSESNMADILANAVKKQQWIVVTGWEPHWMFGRWHLEFLDDPKNIFGGKESIHTIVRKGLKEERPDVYKFLDKFSWTSTDLEQIMVWIHDDKGQFPYEKALRWMLFNKEKVKGWIE